jgi:dTDP-glucose 4,6-dehydratase
MMSDYSQPMNIGNPSELTVLEFAREIIRAVGSRSKVAFKPLPQDDPRQRRPDITKARRILKWEPQVALSAGLVKTIDYFRTKV